MSCKEDCANIAKQKIDAAIDQWLKDGDIVDDPAFPVMA